MITISKLLSTPRNLTKIGDPTNSSTLYMRSSHNCCQRDDPLSDSLPPHLHLSTYRRIHTLSFRRHPRLTTRTPVRGPHGGALFPHHDRGPASPTLLALPAIHPQPIVPVHLMRRPPIARIRDNPI